MDALNGENRVLETRGFIRKKAIALALTVVTGVLVVAAVALVVAGGSMAEDFGHSAILTLLLRIVAWPIDIGLVLVAFALMYFFAPNVKGQRWHWVTPGVITSLVLWPVVSIGLKIYKQFFDRYSETYGSLGAVIALLLWFYLTGAAIWWAGR
jgi:membrane protein